MISTRLRIFLTSFALILLAIACGDAFEYDSNSYYPEDFESSYTKVSDCAQSPTHGNDYVEIWVSPEGADAYNDGTTAFPAGTVIVKPQYSDSGCSESSKWTAMRKIENEAADEVSDWEWQNIEGDGSVAASGQVSACTSCHTGCAGGGFACGRTAPMDSTTE